MSGNSSSARHFQISSSYQEQRWASDHNGQFDRQMNVMVKKMFITSDQGAIIGRNGGIIKGIELASGTRIILKNNKDPKTCTVKIIGTMTEKEAAEKRIRQIMDEMDKNAILDDQIFELKAWKKSLGYNIGEKIRLKCCKKFARGRCKLTEVSVLNV